MIKPTTIRVQEKEGRTPFAQLVFYACSSVSNCLVDMSCVVVMFDSFFRLP